MSGRCTKRDVGISSQLATVSASSMRTSLAETPPAGLPPPPQVPYSHCKPLSPQTLPLKVVEGEVTLYQKNKVSAAPHHHCVGLLKLWESGHPEILPSPQRDKMRSEVNVMFIGKLERDRAASVSVAEGVQGLVPDTSPQDSFLDVEVAGCSRIICWSGLHHYRPGEAKQTEG